MKRPYLHFLQVAVLLLLSNLLFASNPGKDFLITLNGSKLTGNIKRINFSNSASEVLFQNDFGNTYAVHPATIYGFALAENGEISLYESKRFNGKWRFFKAKKGKELSLYTSTERRLKFTRTNDSPIVLEEKNPQNWLQFAGEQPFKVYRFTYKRVLRKKLKSYPDLMKSIGKRGFRYKDLVMIVDLYNKLHTEN